MAQNKGSHKWLVQELEIEKPEMARSGNESRGARNGWSRDQNERSQKWLEEPNTASTGYVSGSTGFLHASSYISKINPVSTRQQAYLVHSATA